MTGRKRVGYFVQKRLHGRIVRPFDEQVNANPDFLGTVTALTGTPFGIVVNDLPAFSL
jgi:hypothetical protein